MLTRFAPVASALVLIPGSLLAQAAAEATAESTTESAPAAARDPYLAALADAEGKPWKSLFNGQDLSGWTPKFTGSELGENLHNTFRVEDGLLTVSYADWTGPFTGQFGHLFADGSYDNYVLRAEYRFVGDQVEGGPGWALRNNGFMIHGEAASELGKDQQFPASIEVQLLGAAEGETRTTGNICTPGTNIHRDGQLVTAHVINSNSKSFAGDQWVTIEVVVHGAEEIRHYINGEEVIRYGGIELDPKDELAQGALKARQAAGDDSLVLGEGSISIQAETAPVQFRKIELLELEQVDFERAKAAAPVADAAPAAATAE